jgi:flagellar basal body-associated protein FliL
MVRYRRMDTEPKPPAKRSKLFLIVVILILAIVVLTFWGMNISHYTQMNGK